MKTTLFAGALVLLLPVIGLAGEYNLTVDRVQIDTGDFVKEGIGYNGASPGRFCALRKARRSRST